MANRVIAGAFDGTYVLRVSRPGYNVLDPLLPATALTFDSRWFDFAVIHSEGQFSTPTYPEGTGPNIYHGLGYVPCVVAFITSYWSGEQVSAQNANLHISADGSYIYVRDNNSVGGTYKYFIFRSSIYG